MSRVGRGYLSWTGITRHGLQELSNTIYTDLCLLTNEHLRLYYLLILPCCAVRTATVSCATNYHGYHGPSSSQALAFVHLVGRGVVCELREDVHASDKERPDFIDLHGTKVWELKGTSGFSGSAKAEERNETDQQLVVVKLGDTLSTLGLSCLPDVFQK